MMQMVISLIATVYVIIVLLFLVSAIARLVQPPLRDMYKGFKTTVIAVATIIFVSVFWPAFVIYEMRKDMIR